jgi:hypothetical protein
MRLACGPSAGKWAMLLWSGVQRSPTIAAAQKPALIAVIVHKGVSAGVPSLVKAARRFTRRCGIESVPALRRASSRTLLDLRLCERRSLS